jgi:NAD(P)-dependent dehydrogenase (short-subunit alcohol dehydrogenase family)
MKKALITGSAGLIGAEAVRFFIKKDFEVIDVDYEIMDGICKGERSKRYNKK